AEARVAERRGEAGDRGLADADLLRQLDARAERHARALLDDVDRDPALHRRQARSREQILPPRRAGGRRGRGHRRPLPESMDTTYSILNLCLQTRFAAVERDHGAVQIGPRLAEIDDEPRDILGRAGAERHAVDGDGPVAALTALMVVVLLGR